MNGISLIIVVPAIIVILVIVGVFLSVLNTWLKAKLNGAPVSVLNLLGMRLGGVPYGLVVEARITAVKAGIPLETDKIAAHYLAGGNVVPTVQALIAAKKAGIALDWDRACAIDLATKGSGKSVEEAVRTSVDPKVIDCPNPQSGRVSISAVAKNGIELKVKARVTVRTNIPRLVGGATEETIVARVGEGILTTIGSAADHKTVLENPDSISRTVLSKGLDAGTAFEILSIDIADIDVGENIGSKLQIDQANADLLVANAKAEERKALAIAMEREMVVEVAANRAKVVLAEAEVPKALAEALRSGKLGAMDYYRMQNMLADTSMRKSLGGPSDDGATPTDKN